MKRIEVGVRVRLPVVQWRFDAPLDSAARFGVAQGISCRMSLVVRSLVYLPVRLWLLIVDEGAGLCAARWVVI